MVCIVHLRLLCANIGRSTVRQPVECSVRVPLAARDSHNSQHVHRLNSPCKWKTNGRTKLNDNFQFEMHCKCIAAYRPGTLTKNFGCMLNCRWNAC